MTSTNTQPSNLNAIRAAFMRRASAPDISPTALKLAYLIAYKYMNNETGTARPSQDALARDLRASVRTVQRLLDILGPLGLVISPGHGPNRASTYWIDPDKATPLSPIGDRKGDIQRQRTRHPATEKATPMSPQLKKKNQEEEPIGAGAHTPAPRGESARELALAVPPGAPAPDGGAPDVDRFGELWGLWSSARLLNTDEHKAEARRVYAIVCRDDDTHDEIMSRARQYLAAKADDRRHIYQLANWLSNDNWRKPPPERKPQRNGGKAPLAGMLLRLGQQP
jgi:hypothetical protein